MDKWKSGRDKIVKLIKDTQTVNSGNMLDDTLIQIKIDNNNAIHIELSAKSFAQLAVKQFDA